MLASILALATLEEDVQAFINNVSAVTGFSLSVGYIDGDGLTFGVGSGPRSPMGSPVVTPGTCDGTDTMLLGSGTKPYTAATIMRLVEAGKMSLNDSAAYHIDWALQRMNGTTLAGIFGPKAANVTIGQLISMRSGIGDYDVPDLDHAMLVNGSTVHSPLEPLYAVAAFAEPDNCKTSNCTWVCDPGNCTAYSSTNFLLAGLALLRHAPEGQQTWQTYDQLAALGITRDAYPHTHTPTSGPMDQRGLTAAGDSKFYGVTTLWHQDASIMGWTCGNVIASAQVPWGRAASIATERPLCSVVGER